MCTVTSPAEVILSMGSKLARDPMPAGTRAEWAGEGEWKITLDVFRDLGIAFGGAVVGIYILLVWQTGSFSMPLVRMISIPLTIIGIMPGFWLLNALWNQPIGGHPNPVYFTATAMIGMIALAGIADRNAILLIDFIHTVLERGGDLRRALIESGAVRFRPIFLTAGAAMLGAWPITLDPVFSGLAWALDLRPGRLDSVHADPRAGRLLDALRERSTSWSGRAGSGGTRSSAGLIAS